MTTKYQKWVDWRQFLKTKKRRRFTKQGYTFKSFDETQSIFVHIPKCAGVSICHALYGNLGGGHVTISKFIDVFGVNCFNHYFTFTITRNPWARLVSAYFFLQEGGLNSKDSLFYENELKKYNSFEDFVLRWVNKDNIMKWYHFIPQNYYFIDNKNRASLDFIGRLENIEQDFTYIKRKIGITTNLDTKNRSKHNDYQQYYSPETIAIVENVYQEDISILGYKFHDNS